MTIEPSLLAIAPQDPVTLLALTAIGEAGGQGYNGMQAAINSIINRVAGGGWAESTIQDVCLAKDQYDCWQPGVDRDRILSLVPSDPVYQQAMTLAKLAVSGVLPDITGGADSFCSVNREEPAWAKAEGAAMKVQINEYKFYATWPKLPRVDHLPSVSEAQDPEPAPVSVPSTPE